MSGLDYYGRLLRRALARPTAGVRSLPDPFETTAPWPLGRGDSSIGKPGVLPMTAAHPPALSSPAPTAAASKESGAVSDDPADEIPLPPDPRNPSETRDAVPPGEPALPASLLPSLPSRPAVAAPPVVAPRIAEHTGLPARPDASAEDEGTARVEARRRAYPPRHTTADLEPVEGESPPAPAATPPLIHPPPTVSWPTPKPGPSRPEAPSVSIGRLDVEIAGPEPAPAPAAPATVVRSAAATGTTWRGAAERELVQGPTHRRFGIGQV